jgi:hypothetical protein
MISLLTPLLLIYMQLHCNVLKLDMRTQAHQQGTQYCGLESGLYSRHTFRKPVTRQSLMIPSLKNYKLGGCEKLCVLTLLPSPSTPTLYNVLHDWKIWDIAVAVLLSLCASHKHLQFVRGLRCNIMDHVADFYYFGAE